MTFVFFLKVEEFPIIASDRFAAVRLTARAGHVKRGMAVAHRVVEANLLIGVDVADGDERDLPLESGIGIARVIHAVGVVIDQGTTQMMINLNLNCAILDDLRLLVQFVGGNDNPAPDGEQFAFGNGFSSEKATAVGRFAPLGAWVVPGKLGKFSQGCVALGA